MTSRPLVPEPQARAGSRHELTNYRTRLVTDLRDIGRDAWDALLALQPEATPFLRFDFLHALHESGSASPDTGWSPQYLTLWQDGPDGEVLAAAVPLYVKGHSYGEYVFDWAWANAYAQHGLEYYPKWLSAVPFTPVQGARLLARDATARAALVDTMLAVARQSELSSLHVLFPTADEAEQLRAAGMLLRQGVQFHWCNSGFASFDDFLAVLEQKKRKNIRAERRRVHDAGITFRHVSGAAATDADWRFFHRCYRTTYREHHSSPYLNLEFFRQIGRTMPENLLLVIASRDGNDIASALLVIDMRPEASVMYGRYWGAIEHHPCLHFETAYYQPLTYCIAHGIRTFEGGAQGEHKMARGFEPVATLSAHWLAHPAFADAVGRFLDRETAGMEAYLDELTDRSPFKQRSGSD
ncbi:N-acetyltransferase [Ralstonia sp. TCR112]|uniref:GNAT family N-acetyltransferase n=1 Tax=Ralstonia sp. TCR112 TaxID=2601730 RepID=UPI0011BFCC1D|nr:GNAT family N-acetyltransferase [Ralstonia sp. TCR112]TXD62998.1 N-acetyltransferase [Ralstonia sp. TCR112]